MIDWQYNPQTGDHRPVTLVFATEKTEDAIKEALQGGKTAVWYDNVLSGKQEFLVPLIQQSLYISKTQVMESYNGKSTVVAVSVDNKSDADYIMQNQSEYSFYDYADIVTLKAHSTTTIHVKPLKEMKTFVLKFKVLNAVTAPATHPVISMNVYTAKN
jgi:hypothetical protein